MSDHRFLQHRRTHNLLLVQKLLSFRSETSPFTLVLDSVEQGAGGLVREITRGAKASKTHIIYVFYTYQKQPPDVDVLIQARRKTPEAVKQEITSAFSPTTKRTLLILYPLTPLLSHTTRTPQFNLPTYLLSLLPSNPQPSSSSLLAIHHLDIPLPLPSYHHYTPAPLPLLSYLATTILTLHSFPQTLAKKNARDRSLRDPVFGLAEEKEGVLTGMGGNAYYYFQNGGGGGGGGMVLELEHRRKSGRAVREKFFLPSPTIPTSSSSLVNDGGEDDRFKGIMLLDEHPLFARPREEPTRGVSGEEEKGEGEDLGGTFKLGLTAKQREVREGVVLPYYDAQRRVGEGDKGGGIGEGGRIVYEMGVEDDFDEEEDEI
ncbi:MAG: hypothetical protein LQ338_007150 [Usnochroma carphineum]|nr:MAG: hypothetical protein LQ338_007150 [Usnochroma carphineum]